MFLKILQYSQETTVLKSLFKKVAGLATRKSIKRRLQHSCFPVNIAEFFRTAFSIEQLWWLLLELRHFLACDTYNVKIYEDSMTQTLSNDFFLGRFRPP